MYVVSWFLFPPWVLTGLWASWRQGTTSFISLVLALWTGPGAQQMLHRCLFALCLLPPHPGVLKEHLTPVWMINQPVSEQTTMYFCGTPKVLCSWVRIARLETRPWVWQAWPLAAAVCQPWDPGLVALPPQVSASASVKKGMKGSCGR